MLLFLRMCDLFTDQCAGWMKIEVDIWQVNGKYPAAVAE